MVLPPEFRTPLMAEVVQRGWTHDVVSKPLQLNRAFVKNAQRSSIPALQVAIALYDSLNLNHGQRIEDDWFKEVVPRITKLSSLRKFFIKGCDFWIQQVAKLLDAERRLKVKLPRAESDDKELLSTAMVNKVIGSVRNIANICRILGQKVNRTKSMAFLKNLESVLNQLISPKTGQLIAARVHKLAESGINAALEQLHQPAAA